MRWLKKIFYGTSTEDTLQKPTPYKNPMSIVKTSGTAGGLFPVQEYFRSILDSLDGYKKVTAIPNLQRAGISVDVSFEFQGGATLAPRKSGAYSLNSAASSKMEFDGAGNYQPDEVIVRINFSYDLYERMKENRVLATYFLQKALDHAKAQTDSLLKIDSSKTLYGNAYLDFNLPGRPDILLELSSQVGYELRFYSKCRN